jgi:predicted acetyltransferase
VDVTIRTATPDDLEPVARLIQRGFTPTPGAAPDLDRPRIDDDRRLVAELDGRLVGHLGAWPLAHWFGGRRVATAGISAVVVAPEARGRGVGTALVRAGLEAARERGEPLSTLFPLTRGIYRRHGYELAGDFPGMAVATAALAALPPPAAGVEVAPGSGDDLDEMLALERELARHEPGMLDRPTTFAARTLQPGEHDAVVLARRAGVLTGYLVYGHTTTRDDQAFYTLDVKEIVGRDVDTLRALWHVLGSNASAATTAELVLAPQDPLELALPERAMRPAPTPWRWMTRLVDPAAAVAARGWPAHVRGVCHLTITDPLWPDAGGAFTFELADGEASLTRGGDGHVAVDVGALASWFTGYSSPVTLARAGRLSGATEADLAVLDVATAGRTPWVRTFF